MMQILSSANEIEKNICDFIVKFNNISISVAWASASSKAFKVLKKEENKKKIQSSTVGLHFYQTHPDFIKEFLDDKKIKFYKQDDGVFHPKIYLFWNDDNDWICLSGSANFTQSALTKNSEIMTMFDCNDGVKFHDIKDIIDAYYLNSSVMTQEKLDEYIDESKKNKKETKDNFRLNKSIKDMTWDEYYKYILENAQGLDNRLKLLNKAGQIFSKPLEKISDDEFLYIAGVYNRDEDDVYWEYFGTMKRTGLSNFKITKKIFIEMDECFNNKEFQKEEFIDFAKKIDKIKGISLTAMSRLIAMRYPDRFYCITSANEPELLNKFLISKSIRNDSSYEKYKRYWNEIIEPVRQSPWYNSDKPTDPKELQVWKGRVILLDALFYN